MKMSCGSSNSPGAEPLRPQALMNFPSGENFTMRAELCALGSCPSLTKMSPFGAIATPVGRSKVPGRHGVEAAMKHPHIAVARHMHANDFAPFAAIHAGRNGRPAFNQPVRIGQIGGFWISRLRLRGEPRDNSGARTNHDGKTAGP